MGGFNTSPFNSQVWNALSAAQGVNILVSDMIYHAYRIAGVLDEAGRGYSNSQYIDGLWELNQQISQWKAQRNMVYAILRTIWNIKIGQGGPTNPYLVGPGSPDIDLERPVRIEAAGYIFTNATPNIEQPFDILSAQEYEALSPKDLTSGNPTKLYYEPSVPNGKIYVWPISASGVVTKGSLYTWQTVNQFLNATDPIVTAPAYVDAMTYNLAIRLAARNPNRQKLSSWALVNAREGVAFIKSVNAPPYLQQVERGCMGVGQGRGNFNILSNSYVP